MENPHCENALGDGNRRTAQRMLALRATHRLGSAPLRPDVVHCGSQTQPRRSPRAGRDLQQFGTGAPKLQQQEGQGDGDVPANRFANLVKCPGPWRLCREVVPGGCAGWRIPDGKHRRLALGHVYAHAFGEYRTANGAQYPAAGTGTGTGHPPTNRDR